MLKNYEMHTIFVYGVHVFRNWVQWKWHFILSGLFVWTPALCYNFLRPTPIDLMVYYVIVGEVWNATCWSETGSRLLAACCEMKYHADFKWNPASNNSPTDSRIEHLQQFLLVILFEPQGIALLAICQPCNNRLGILFQRENPRDIHCIPLISAHSTFAGHCALNRSIKHDVLRAENHARTGCLAFNSKMDVGLYWPG